MGVPDEMDTALPKKRSHHDDCFEKKKAKRKKPFHEDVKVQRAAILGEIPNLFHMQIEELLKEVKMKKKLQQKLTCCVDRIKEILLNMSPGKVHKINAQKWLKDIHLPVIQEPAMVKGCFQFQAPVRVFVGGSALFSMNVDPDKTVDLFLEIPKNCLQSKDYLNHRYIRKRALYLAAVAQRLSKVDIVESMRFTYHNGNVYKPVLVLKACGNSHPLTLHLHVIAEEGVFKLSRFHIEKNSIRPRWFFEEKVTETNEVYDAIDSTLPPTPVYNSSVLQDLCYESNAAFLSQHLKAAPSVQDGIVLLKVWMRQRELCTGTGCFSGFLMAVYVCHLLEKGLVRTSMTAFQVLRTVIFQLSTSQWLEKPISLCETLGEGNRPTMAQFQKHFDVVFVDISGFLNLCLGMTKAMYARIVHEAQIAAAFLNTEESENFDLLLMTPCPFQLKFDLILSIKLSEKSLSWVAEKLDVSQLKIDHCGSHVAAIIPRVLDLLEQALGDRLTLLYLQPQPVSTWSLTEDPPAMASDCTLTFGLLLHKTNSLRLIDRGPPANSPEAAEFRTFWGSKSELRRFKDGGISEAVVWSFSTVLNQKRHVCAKIISHVLKSHAGIEPDQIQVLGQQIESVLHVPRRLVSETVQDGRKESKEIKKDSSVCNYGTGEERIYQIRQVLEELGKTLRRLELSLRISAVVGIDPVFRFAEVFPAHPAVSTLTSENIMRRDGCPLPLYTPAMTVICTLEGSGKWPEDVARIRQLKTLYLLDLGEKLTGLDLAVHVQDTFVDVLKDGFVFRLKLGVTREIGVLRMVYGPGGILKMEDTPEALAVEAEITAKPALTIELQGVQQEHPSFCVTVRLVKRWLAAQLLLGHVPERVAEKTVVHVFDHPLPFTAPVSPFVGFLRTLKLMSSNQWTSLVERSYDKVMQPLPVVISNWLQKIAAQSLKVLQSNPESEWKVIFKPPLDVYDAVIHLSTHCLARKYQSVGTKEFTVSAYPQPPRSTGTKRSAEIALPVTDFNPAEIFLEQLQDAYGDFALFFHDVYGGSIIAVLLKPGLSSAKKVEIGNLFGQKPTVVDGEPALVFDFEAMILGVESLGGDLVTKVDLHQKWKK